MRMREDAAGEPDPGPCTRTYDRTALVWRTECGVFEATRETSFAPAKCPHCGFPFPSLTQRSTPRMTR